MTTFTTGHVGLNVTDLDRAVGFYTDVFGFEVQGRSDEDGHAYAFLGTGETLVLTLWQQANGTFDTARPGLHHLSFQVDAVDDVTTVEARVRAQGTRLYHDGVVAHGEGVSSGGVFFEDPDGTRLEVFTTALGEHALAPNGTAPTCGFF